jgi:hypothetical protein
MVEAATPIALNPPVIHSFFAQHSRLTFITSIRFSAVAATFLCLFSQLSIDSIDNNPSVTCLAEPMFSPFYQITSVIVA